MSPKSITFVCLLLCVFAGWTFSHPKTEKPQVQLAILLDTSNSMDGLIEQAKTQLWKIVNELALSRQNDHPIELNVALYEYGKSSIPANEGHLRMISSLTTDLDKISEELFKLTTNGGDEYCGQVIESAVNALQWNPDNDQLKIIFIAGNEPFTQGQIDYKSSCRKAIEKGIIVNTIYCGDYDEGIATSWKDGADLADGKYINIDQNQQLVHIEAPQDTLLARLGRELNKTYIAYGTRGKELKERQEAQDQNALMMSAPVMAQRSVAKASGQYKNTSWDLVDAESEGAVAIEDLEAEELPKEMRDMDGEERKAYIEKKANERKKIQEQINQLNKERRKYVAEQMTKLPGNTLDAVMIQAIREQAEKKNYQFEN